MDGTSVSGGGGFVTAGMLGTLRLMLDAKSDHRTLLNQVDLFVGTSAGSFNALFFAMHEDPDDALRDILDFWGEVVTMNRDGFSVVRALGAATGHSSLFSSADMRQFFINYFGANTRLGDLKKKVAIPSFQLDGRMPRIRTWKPKIFHNTGHPNDPDLDERVVDVALRSGSPPLVYPIYQGLDEQGSGYVDGGVYANNPAAVGLAQALQVLAHGDAPSPALQDHAADLGGILLLSMGNARVSSFLAPRFCKGTANWGFAEWLLDLRDPAVLVTMLLESGTQAVNYQCRCTLQKQFFRFDPIIDSAFEVSTSKGVQAAIERLASLDSTQQDLRMAMRWLDTQGWLDEGPACASDDSTETPTTSAGEDGDTPGID